MAKGESPTVFISYSHQDEEWKELLLPQFKQLEMLHLLEVWDDRKIRHGQDWYARIKEVLERTRFAVCLISANFLSSSFCMDEEIPYLLQQRFQSGVEILPILVEDCVWEAHPWLKRLHMVPTDGKNLTTHYRDDPAQVFRLVAQQVYDALQPGYVAQEPPPPAGTPPEELDIDRLPETGDLLFGRRKEMALLDEAWKNDTTRIVVFKAWGGVGKSTLVRIWLQAMTEDNYRGAERVFGWSFYSQGTGDRVTSADQFIATALEFFGDEDPNAGSPWDKGERLAAFVARQRTLLLLDGMEPLQSDAAFGRGSVKDPALQTLLVNLARANPGLCVVSTRENVTDLQDDRIADAVEHCDLEQVSDIAGRALLRVRGIRGTDQELEQAVRRFGNHALAVNLLASYLQETTQSEITLADSISDIDVPPEQGKHPRRVVAAFEKRFGEGPEVELLRILGLFDRPATKEELAAITANPPIARLTDKFVGSTESSADGSIIPGGSSFVDATVLERLRQFGLIAPQSKHRPDILDAHPLIREHFAGQLDEHLPDTAREAHRRLFEYLKQSAPELPSNLNDMMPLYHSVAHGCKGGLSEEALQDVYIRRIQRESEYFANSKLGTISTSLAAISNFFDPPWKDLVGNLSDASKGFLMNHGGFCLRSQCRFVDALDALRIGLKTYEAIENWERAADTAGIIALTHLPLGNLDQALEAGRISIEHADKSGAWFQKMTRRVTYGAVLHQLGSTNEARAQFMSAERIRRDADQDCPILVNFEAFFFNELLLDMDECKSVIERTDHNLDWATNRNTTLSQLAFIHLNRGLAFLKESQHDKRFLKKADEHLHLALEKFRVSARRDYLPYGLVAGARLELAKASSSEERNAEQPLQLAKAFLTEAEMIASTGPMQLHIVDIHLGWIRYFRAIGQEQNANDRLQSAADLVAKIGYRRRGSELQALLGKQSS